MNAALITVLIVCTVAAINVLIIRGFMIRNATMNRLDSQAPGAVAPAAAPQPFSKAA